MMNLNNFPQLSPNLRQSKTTSTTNSTSLSRGKPTSAKQTTAPTTPTRWDKP